MPVEAHEREVPPDTLRRRGSAVDRARSTMALSSTIPSPDCRKRNFYMKSVVFAVLTLFAVMTFIPEAGAVCALATATACAGHRGAVAVRRPHVHHVPAAVRKIMSLPQSTAGVR
jgi:hypothetical protein